MLDTPQRMLEYAAKRRANKPSYVLPADDLLDLFIHRTELKDKMTEEELALVIASALRRTATLFWWLKLVDDGPGLILTELDNCLEAADRDKSDAASSVVELAAVYADDQQLDDLRTKLSQSRYQHFREAGQMWSGRQVQLAKVRDRILRAKWHQKLQRAMAVDELETYATELAIRPQGQDASLARRLGDTTRVIWSIRSAYAKTVIA